MIRKLKNEFKNPIYKEDMIPVLTRGLITTLLYSILLAIINMLIVKFLGMSFTIIIYFLGYFISREVSSNYYSRHIIYPIISIIYLFLGMIIYHSVTILLLSPSLELILPALKIGFLQTVMPFNIMTYINTNNILSELLYLIIIVWTIITTYRNTKNNYY